jgi:hypothetical protein
MVSGEREPYSSMADQPWGKKTPGREISKHPNDEDTSEPHMRRPSMARLALNTEALMSAPGPQQEELNPLGAF